MPDKKINYLWIWINEWILVIQVHPNGIWVKMDKLGYIKRVNHVVGIIYICNREDFLKVTSIQLKWALIQYVALRACQTFLCFLQLPFYSNGPFSFIASPQSNFKEKGYCMLCYDSKEKPWEMFYKRLWFIVFD